MNEPPGCQAGSIPFFAIHVRLPEVIDTTTTFRALSEGPRLSSSASDAPSGHHTGDSADVVSPPYASASHRWSGQ